MLIADGLGIQPSYASTLDLGGASPVAAISQAVGAIQAGLCKIVLFTIGQNAGTNYRQGPPTHGTLNWGYSDFEEPFGLVGAPGAYALGARRHMHKYGTTAEQLGAIAVSTRYHASLNKNAQIQSPISLEDYLASPVICDPFRLLDCSLISDYSGAFIVTSMDRARDLPQPIVEVAAICQKHHHRYVYTAGDLTTSVCTQLAPKLYKEAGISPDDVDIAQLYDSFTYTVLLQLEAYGFCKKGNVGSLLENGGIGLGGSLPVNTHGGLLSQGHSNGVLHVTEAVKQLRGDCGARQVKKAQNILVTGGGGILFASHAATILRKI
jgi:acetyl-CoA acetyltransferase